MQHVPFLDVFEDASGGNIKTLNKDFLEKGEIPVIDQGQSLIAGYVNDPEKICKSKPPVIVFGDHTKAIKYVDFHFAMGADGTKVLAPKVGGHAKYLFYALRTLHIPDAGYSRHYKFLKETTIPLPPLAEQKRIAAILDAADALRAKRRETLAQLDALLQSTFLTLFGDPAENPKKWPLHTVGSLACKFSDGPFGSNLKSAHYTETGVRVIRLQNIGIGEFVNKDTAFISTKHFSVLKKHECLPGDVLIGTLGDPNLRACIQPEWLRAALNKADCVQLRPDSKVSTAAFVCALLNQPSTERLAQSLMQGQTRVRISMGRLRNLEVPIPPLPLQQKFAAIVESIERQKSAQRAHLAELDALFAALQHRAFRGEL
jgi:type I restriction enzyme S subunit